MKPPILILIVTARLATIPVAQAESPEPADRPRPPRQHRLEQLNPEQRVYLEHRVDEAWAALPLETKVRALRIAQALRDLPPEDQRLFHERIERFLNMPPEERERLRRNRERWERMTPEQRERAREAFRKRRQEFERRWSEPPPPRPALPPPSPDKPTD